MTPRILLFAGLLALAVFGGLAGSLRRLPSGGSWWSWTRRPGRDPAVLAEARAAVARAGDEAQLRVPRTSTEQLSVTHYFAARGYDLVVGVGLDHRVAVSPVAARFPHTRSWPPSPARWPRALAQLK